MSSPDNLIDGRAIAERTNTETALRIETLKSKGITPGLAFVRVGEDPASQVYVGMKEKVARRLGIHSETKVLPENTTQEELLRVVTELNGNSAVHGILVQAPIPAQIDSTIVYSAILPEKDVDGFHPVNVGKLMLGDTSGFVPCTPAGVHQLLIACRTPIPGSEVVILGRGNIVGKPMAALLMQKAREATPPLALDSEVLRTLIASTARPIDDAPADSAGTGQINVEAALAALDEMLAKR